VRRGGLLLSLILERRAAEQAPPFVPRELTAEEHAELAAHAARGKWDRDAEEREATPAAIRDLARRAFVAFRKTRAKPPPVRERVYGKGAT
jgi:hypothetical protein